MKVVIAIIRAVSSKRIAVRTSHLCFLIFRTQLLIMRREFGKEEEFSAKGRTIDASGDAVKMVTAPSRSRLCKSLRKGDAGDARSPCGRGWGVRSAKRVGMEGGEGIRRRVWGTFFRIWGGRTQR